MIERSIGGELKLPYSRYSSLHLLRQTGLVAGTRIAGGMLIVMALFTFGSREALAAVELVVAIGLLTLPDLIAFTAFLRWRRLADGRVRYLLGPSGIWSWDGVQESSTAWGAFHDVQTKRDAWVFARRDGGLWVVPRAAFSAEDLPAAEALIRWKIPAPTQRRR